MGVRGPKSTIESRIEEVLEKLPHATTGDVASALGVSRQRVHQAAQKYGIRLRGTRRASDPTRRKPGPPKPTAITGGVQPQLTHTVCGTISELLAAADLMTRGYRVYMPIARQRCHDLIAVSPEGKLVTIEVRSGRRCPVGNGHTYPSNRTVKSDVTAVVLVGEPVIYEPVNVI